VQCRHDLSKTIQSERARKKHLTQSSSLLLIQAFSKHTHTQNRLLVEERIGCVVFSPQRHAKNQHHQERSVHHHVPEAFASHKGQTEVEYHSDDTVEGRRKDGDAPRVQAMRVGVRETLNVQRRQMLHKPSLYFTTVTSANSSIDCAHKTALLGSSSAVAACGRPHTVKPSFGFSPKSTYRRLRNGYGKSSD